MRPQLIVKVIFFTFLIPGGVTILVPFLILGNSSIRTRPEFSAFRGFALLLGLIAWAILLHCIWEFAFHGKGTLAPVDPPKRLVGRGLYRYTRNPMYLAVFVVLLAETLFFQSRSLLVYMTIFALAVQVFVRFYEEPHLTNQFGAQYLEYCRKVPRWGITNHPFNDIDGVV